LLTELRLCVSGDANGADVHRAAKGPLRAIREDEVEGAARAHQSLSQRRVKRQGQLRTDNADLPGPSCSGGGAFQAGHLPG